MAIGQGGTQGGGAAAVGAAGRDIRLDFFRGLALIFIFLDHIPDNALNWATIRNFGFSDASEIFVFVSGYSAALAYGSGLARDGFGFTAARIWKRCWQIYVAQILLFVAFTAQVAYTAAHFNNPMFSEEMNIVDFLNAPHVTLLQALLLRFRPANMDILPLYIVLLGAFPPVLWAASKRPGLTVALSAALYLLGIFTHWNLDAWPDGKWLFNPLTWQFLFVIGAALAMTRGRNDRLLRRRRWAVGLAAAYLLAALLMALSWHFAWLERLVPDVVQSLLYPIDKTNLDILRLLHFLALAYLISVVVPVDSPILGWPALRPVVRCGQHSLEVFCLGLFLSFLGHMVLVEVDGSWASQLAVSALGIALMVGMGYYLQWYRRTERAAAGGKR